MPPEPQPQAAPKTPKPAQQVAPRLADVFFYESASFNSGSNSASVGMKDVVSIVPACVDSAGRVSATSDSGDRPSDGLLVTLKKATRDGKTVLKSHLVPWANIRDVAFEDVEVAQPTPAPAA